MCLSLNAVNELQITWVFYCSSTCILIDAYIIICCFWLFAVWICRLETLWGCIISTGAKFIIPQPSGTLLQCRLKPPKTFCLSSNHLLEYWFAWFLWFLQVAWSSSLLIGQWQERFHNPLRKLLFNTERSLGTQEISTILFDVYTWSLICAVQLFEGLSGQNLRLAKVVGWWLSVSTRSCKSYCTFTERKFKHFQLI